jgi:hypothetical protein
MTMPRCAAARLAYCKKDSFTDYVHSDRQVLFGTLAYDLTPQSTLTTGISWQKTDTVPIFTACRVHQLLQRVCPAPPFWEPAGTTSPSRNERLRRART